MPSLKLPEQQTTRVRFSIALVLPVIVKSEMNLREHWGSRRKRFDGQKDAVFKALDALGWYSDVMGYLWPFGFPVTITLTRIYHQTRGKRMDDDNLRSAFKAIRDAVAEWAGVDDGGDQIHWAYDQRPGVAGVELKIEGAK